LFLPARLRPDRGLLLISASCDPTTPIAMKHELHPGFVATIEGDGISLVRPLWPSIVDNVASAIAELRDNYTDGRGTGDVWSEIVEPTIVPTGARSRARLHVHVARRRRSARDHADGGRRRGHRVHRGWLSRLFPGPSDANPDGAPKYPVSGQIRGSIDQSSHALRALRAALDGRVLISKVRDSESVFPRSKSCTP